MRRLGIRKVRPPDKPPQKPERLSFVFSSVALVVSLFGTGIALWQTLLVEQQIDAADRNRSFESLVQQAGRVCDLFYPSKIAHYRYAAQNDGTSILIVAREDIDPAIYQPPFLDQLSDEVRKLRLAFTVAQIWARGAQADNLEKAETATMELLYPLSSSAISSDVHHQDVFAGRFSLAAHSCTNDGGETTSTLLAGLAKSKTWWLDTEMFKSQAAIISRSQLATISLDEIRAVAKAQSETVLESDYVRP